MCRRDSGEERREKGGKKPNLCNSNEKTIDHGEAGGRHVEPVGRLNPSASFREKNKMINFITNVGAAHRTNEPEWGTKN